MKRRMPFVPALAAAAISLGPGLATGHDTDYGTTTDYRNWMTTHNDTGWDSRYEAGFVSESPKCVGGREAKLIVVFDGEPRVVDRGETSRNGYLLLSAEGGPNQASKFDKVKFSLARERVGPRDHRHTCSGFRETQ